MDVINIDAITAKDWLDKNEAILIDVREKAEHDSEKITGSILCSLSSICCDKIPSTEQKIIIYCQRGLRGNNACQKLLSENENLPVFNIEGGIEAWIRNGFLTEKGKARVLPLDRQVQICIGSSVLIFSLLAYFTNPSYALGAAFFGAGLINAGLSGWCGLAKIIAKAPWNN